MIHGNLQLTDYDTVRRPEAHDAVLHTTALSSVLAAELVGAAEALHLTCEAILVAALGRAIQRAVGEGFISVDVARGPEASHSLALACAGPDDVAASDLLMSVHHPLSAPTGCRVGRTEIDTLSDVLFAYGVPLVEPAPFGHYLELHVVHDGDALRLDWWYDGRSFEPYTIVELAEQLPYAMIELTSEAEPTLLVTRELAAAY